MNNQKQYEDQNRGLPTRFELNAKGGFSLIGGKEKVDDGVSMFLAFVGWFRLYTPDYIINAYRFVQNTTSYLFRFKNILRLKILESARKYVPFCNFITTDIPLNYQNRKEATIYIKFQYKLRNLESTQIIKRIID